MPTVRNLSETVKMKFLQLSGGTMSGDIRFPTGNIFSKETDTLKELLVGSDGNGNYGAFISLRRTDSADGSGAFGLFTRNADSTLGPSLFATTNGNLTWNGNKVVCVATWQSGYNWYRKYSDGWIEQGGHWYCPTTDTHQTVSYNVAFVDTNYTLQISMHSDRTNVNSGHSDWIQAKSTTGCTLHLDTYPGTMNWYACGR